MRSLLLSAAALATVLAVPAAARADVAPPPGYVEACTLEKQKKPELDCHSCAAFYGNATHCPESLEAYGFKQQCRSRGASVWSEVWCRPASASAPKVPPEVLGQLGQSNAKAPPPPATGALAAPSVAPSVPPAVTPAAPPAATAPLTPGAPEPPPPVPPPSGGCGSCAAGAGGSIGWVAPVLAIAAALLGLARRRGVTTTARGSRRPPPRA